VGFVLGGDVDHVRLTIGVKMGKRVLWGCRHCFRGVGTAIWCGIIAP
jgi:hypothetical protein